MFSNEDKGFVACKTCLEANAPQDEYCHICGSSLEDSDDENDGIYPSEMYAHAADDDPLGVFAAFDEGDTMVRLSTRMCVRCDSAFHECTCGDDYMPFDAVLLEVYEDGLDAYETTSACDTCLFAHTPRCEPLRGWLRTWLEDRNRSSYDYLNGCEDYRSY